jgi:hypothetical protein
MNYGQNQDPYVVAKQESNNEISGNGIVYNYQASLTSRTSPFRISDLVIRA